MDEKPSDVLSIEELSAYLKIPKSTLYKLVREGKVPCQKIGRHLRFRKEAIDRWLEGTHADTTNRQDGRFERTEGAPEGRGPGKARIEDGGDE
jgi:excisionase family DNA binding protein